MPCYDPPPTADMIARWRDDYAKEGNWESWYRLTPRQSLEQWLCDALRGNPIHPDCAKWFEVHKMLEKKP